MYKEVHINETTPEERANIIESKWVHRGKAEEVRCRIVAKGYNENINDEGDIYASPPLCAILRTILATSLAKGWKLKIGDISAAFLHAAVQTQESNVRTSRKSSSMARPSSKSTTTARIHPTGIVFRHPHNKAYIMVYVDDLLFTGEEQEINGILEQIQQHMLLRPTGESTRFPSSEGNHKQRQLLRNYDNILQEAQLEINMQSCDNTGNNSNKGDH